MDGRWITAGRPGAGGSSADGRFGGVKLACRAGTILGGTRDDAGAALMETSEVVAEHMAVEWGDASMHPPVDELGRRAADARPADERERAAFWDRLMDEHGDSRIERASAGRAHVFAALRQRHSGR